MWLTLVLTFLVVQLMKLQANGVNVNDIHDITKRRVRMMPMPGPRPRPFPRPGYGTPGYGPYWMDDYEQNDTSVTSFNMDTERCCAGSTYPRSPNSYMDCCGSSEYDTTRQKCCDKTVHDLRPGFDCCGKEYFSVKEAICCISPLTSNSTLKVFPPEIAGDPEAIANSQCCGLKVFDSRKYICCARSPNKRLFAYHDYHMSYNNGHPRMEGGKAYYYQAYIQQQMINRHYTMANIMRPHYTLFEKKFTNSGCCKGQLYDKDAKTCPIRDIQPEIMPRPYADDFQGLLPRHPGRPMFGRCNNDRYNMESHICCTFFEFVNGSKNFHQESKLHSKINTNSGCCGTEIFDREMEVCCNNRRVHKQNEEGSIFCCGNDTYDISKQECCESSNFVENIESLTDTADSCCGESRIPYDSNNQVCCGNQVLDIPKSENTTRRQRNSFFHCCYDPASNSLPSLYNPHTEVCCGGLVASNKGHRQGCCGNQAMDWRNNLCCDGKLYNKTSFRSSCCGEASYDTSTHICCVDNIIEKKTAHDNCCGSKPFNYETELCCYPSGTIYQFQGSSNSEVAVIEKTSPTSACCNLAAYDTTTQQCCGSTVIDTEKELCCYYHGENTFESAAVPKTSPNSRCCGPDVYDPDTERCCNNTVIPAGDDNDLSCCGSKLFDAGQQLCCNGEVYDLGVGEDLTCCGKQVYDAKNKICCRGAVRDAVESSVTACCYANKDHF